MMGSAELAAQSEGQGGSIMTINPFSNLQNFETAKNMASFLAQSTMVPDAFQGAKGEANCLIAMEMASRLGIGMLECFQNISIIYGRPSFSSSFLIARVNASGLFKGHLRFRFTKDRQSCYAYAIDKETGEELCGQVISVDMAKRAKWYDRNGSHWTYMSEQMLRYRAAAFFVRAYCPEIILGLRTREELMDMGSKDENLDRLNKGLVGEPVDANTIDTEASAIASDVEIVEEEEFLRSVKPAEPATAGRAVEPVSEKPAALEKNTKPKRSPEEMEIAEKGKQALALYKEFFGRGDLASAEIVQVTGKSDARGWTLDDVTKLHKHLKTLREAKPVAVTEANDEPPAPDFPFGAPEPAKTPPAGEERAAADEDAAFI